jgi:outer membrane receptor protein involved in Fe transport
MKLTLVIKEQGAQMANSISSFSARRKWIGISKWPSAILSIFGKQRLSLLRAALLLVVATGAALAQSTGKISGVATDAETGEPLIGANIVLIGTSLGASTDLDGNYFILNVPAGKYDIQASMIGYQRVIQKDIIVDAGRTTSADFKLKASAIEQEAVVVEAVRPDVEREKTSTSAIIRSDDVQQIPGMRTVGDVIGLAADVTDGHFRGGREGEELYTLQGMGIVNPLDNSTALLPIMSAVEEVEVVTSGFGAQYGNAQSGVVNIIMKEGKSDKWRSYAEVNMRMPGKKYFGANPFDVNANRYLQTLLNPATWNSPNSDEPGFGYWTGMGSNIATMFGRDTAAQIAMARSLWRQARPYINNNSYEKNIDYSVEVSAGGPLSESSRMFLAVRNETTWPVYPVEHPDVQQQIMGNIVSDLASGSSLRISGAYSETNTNRFPSENSATSPGYLKFLWDYILGVQYRHLTNTQIGARYTHALSPSTFYDIKLNAFLTRRREGSSPYIENLTDEQLGNMRFVQSMVQPVKAPDGFTVGAGSDNFFDDRTYTYSLDASLTSQVTKSHLITGGLQANLYDLNIKEHRNMDQDPPYYTEYTAQPYETGLYVQDKMEFQGMVANIGLRWDLWNENTKYNPNIYTPYYIDTTYLGKAAYTVRSPIFGRLQPRIGLSFPVSPTTVFHLNYGAFLQRPSFQYIFDSRNAVNPTRTVDPLKPVQLGNPTLKPQTTYSYDVGVMQGLGEGFTLDVSGYYKNVQDLVQQAIFAGPNGTNSYSTYINRDYADIRGFRIALNKRRGNIVGSINYQYSVATGKSSTVGSMLPSYVQGEPPELSKTSKKDILLDFDREHNLIINIGYITDKDFGMRIGKVHPLGDISIYANSFIRSGRPFSYSPLVGDKEVNNMRTPWEYNTDLKIAKRIRNFFGLSATFYIEVFNLFDNTILNYDYIFLSDNFGSNNNNAVLYETIPLNAPNGLRYSNTEHAGDPNLTVDKSFLIYSNEPRSYHIGFSIDF